MADVLLALTDLLFLTRLRAAAQSLGLTVERATTPDEVLERARREAPAAVILDLQAERLDPMRVIAEIKADATLRHIRTIGYVAHVRDDLKEHAHRAGCDLVLPRSAFVARLSELLAQIAADRTRARSAE
ncbi:MAG: response regulator [Blastocatellia bacterium]|nr:response regulator [Blastocatellia bacterium]MCS7158134.1 response regulator [Blastocatellia bacterium]MCX7753003.1 response regulator [Blastocatellia bacterium]MDW8168526.1 response regulator [Acidobacteriota bacterium]MDW8256940.1 response regulator [Acidobacteriota bacterium]